jgi:hypothetical protein
MTFQTGSIDKNGLARTADGKLYVSVSTDSGAIVSDTYTPTLTNGANVAASTAFVANYSRVGSVVTVSGVVNIQCTANGLATALGISLPVASNLGAAGDLGGTAVVGAVASLCAAVSPDTTNDRASLSFVNVTDTTNRSWYYHFTYRII